MAYRECYNTKGTNDTVSGSAWALLDTPLVASTIDRLQRNLCERTDLTLERMVAEGFMIVHNAMQAGQFGAAATAHKTLCRMAGLTDKGKQEPEQRQNIIGFRVVSAEEAGGWPDKENRFPEQAPLVEPVDPIA